MSPTAVQRWLQAHCEQCPEAIAAVVWARAGDAGFEAVAEWPASAGPLRVSLVACAKAALQRGQPVLMTPAVTVAHAEHARVIALPLRMADEAVGAVALAVNAADEAAARALLDDLERGLRVLALAVSDPQQPLVAGTAPQGVDSARILRLHAVLMGGGGLAEAATELVNELAVQFDFDRVSLGVQDESGLRVVAVSHSGEFARRQELLRELAAAMHEAIDQGASVSHPAHHGAVPRVILAHADLSARSGFSVCTVPLLQDERRIGALTFERQGEAPDAAALQQYEHMAALLAPLVALRQRAELSWGRRTTESLRVQRRRLSRNPRTRPIAAAVVLALAGITLLPLPYRVGASARLEGAVQRIVAAPADGFLRASHVRPGDLVKAGDVLVELADQDLRLEKRRWESELAQHENNFGAALARADRPQFVIYQARATEARAQLELVESQLQRTQLVAPIAGVVIKGDLNQALGAPVQRGDALLTIAPADHYRVIVDVDERDIAHVSVGQRGRLALSSLPGETLPFVIDRVTPVANAKDGRNTFEVQAVPEGNLRPLRPGLLGVAKIEVGSRSALWLATHRVTDWLRLTLWSWGG